MRRFPAARTQMMRYDAQAPDVRRALRDARTSIKLGSCERLTVAEVQRRDLGEPRQPVRRMLFPPY